MECSRPEYWGGLPFPSPGDLPNPEIEPRSATLQMDCLPAEPRGKIYYLFLPYYWEEPLWVLSASWIMSCPLCLVGTRAFPISVQELRIVCLNVLCGSFSGSFLTHICCSVLKPQIQQISRVLSVHLVSLCYSVLWTLAPLAFPGFYPCLFHSGAP